MSVLLRWRKGVVVWMVGPSPPRAYPARGAPLARAPFAMRKGRGSCWLFRLLRRWGFCAGPLGHATRNGFNNTPADFPAGTYFNEID